jgi:hypothetical protein
MTSVFCGCEANSSFRTHGTDQLRYIEKNPNKYAGMLFAFQGEVIQAQELNGGIVFQILTKDYYSYDFGPSLAVFFKQSNTSIIKGSFVTVLGRIGSPIEGRNAFGATVSSVTMEAIAVRTLSPSIYNINRYGRHGDAQLESAMQTMSTLYYLPKDEATVKQWQSGELFSPKKPDKTK